MNRENYEKMKKIVLSLAEVWNCPNTWLEEETGFTWMQYHDLRIELEKEE